MREVRVYSRPSLWIDGVHTHYCPGCGHGIMHRILCEVVEELDMVNETIGIAPVGCAAMMYNYLDLDFIESPHGRAPAIATGLKRSNPERTIFTYQGDGDLASIGMAEIIHAANRGEKITVIFINNAIYGMTGGQMAPTTMPEQVTTTSVKGRDPETCGYPVRICELLSSLCTPAYIERVSLANPHYIRKAKEALTKAFTCQRDGKGFSLVEVLSNCPTNWKMSPIEAFRWQEENMMPYYPLGVYKDFQQRREEE